MPAISCVRNQPRSAHSTARLTLVVAVVLGFIELLATVRQRVWVNFTPSLPRGIYLRESGPPARGDIVVACPPIEAAHLAKPRRYLWPGGCPGGVAPIGKRVVAMAGDTVEVSPVGVRVNGRLIAASRPRFQDGHGRRLVAYPSGAYMVDSGEFWLLATRHPLSFDSRYFGPIRAVDIRATVRILW